MGDSGKSFASCLVSRYGLDLIRLFKMTFYHFVNCMALACVPFHLVYKYTRLAEYGAFWKCVTAGFVYIMTQLVKMMFLATFFPSSGDDDWELEGSAATTVGSDFTTESFSCGLE